MKKTTKHKFAVGDRVVYHAVESGNGWLDGMVGTVIYVDNTRCPYTVEFEDPIMDGVTDSRAVQLGFEPRPWHGWFCREENLKKVRGKKNEKAV